MLLQIQHMRVLPQEEAMDSMMLRRVASIGTDGTSRDNRYIGARLDIEIIIDQIRKSAVRYQRRNKYLFLLRRGRNVDIDPRFVFFRNNLNVLRIMPSRGFAIGTNIIRRALRNLLPVGNFLQHSLYIIFHSVLSLLSVLGTKALALFIHQLRKHFSSRALRPYLTRG